MKGKEKFKVVDLTHTLSDATPTWDSVCGFELSTDTDYEDCTSPDLFRIQKIKEKAGIGTHMDAPAHVIPDAQTIDKLGLDRAYISNIENGRMNPTLSTLEKITIALGISSSELLK